MSTLLVNRRFALLLAGRAASNVGDWTFSTAVTIWITVGIARGQAWAPLAVAGVSVVIAVPTLVVGPLAGVFVDRWDRRRTMLRVDALRAALAAALIVFSLAGAGLPDLVRVAGVYAVVGLATVCSTFFTPAQVALVGDLVPPEERVRASSLVQLAVSGGQVVGPTLGAALYFAWGVQWAMAVDAASFLASYAVIRAIAARPEAAAPAATAAGPGAVAGELAGGLAFVARDRTLRALLLSLLLANAGASSVAVLGIFFLQENLHAAPSWYGAMGSVGAAASLAGAAAGAVLSRRLARPWLFPASVIAMGCVMLVYARLTAIGPALALVFLLGLCRVAILVAIMPILLAVTPDGLLGRVSATINPALSIGVLAATPLAGALAAGLRGLDAHPLGVHVGRIDAIYAGAGLLVTAAGLLALLSMRVPVTPPARPDGRAQPPPPGSEPAASRTGAERAS
ncbi:MAG TPA: MFS transporter [Candidatus Dormibacteraeota bacterium]|nr:MFS transporter [Candidatus Dormibacteraeota bacterium]